MQGAETWAAKKAQSWEEVGRGRNEDVQMEGQEKWEKYPREKVQVVGTCYEGTRNMWGEG